jgi:sugar lactone lactonase YvrE
MHRNIHKTTLVLVGVLALATGCAGSQKPQARLVWPPPPEVGRVEYVRIIQGSKDLESGGRKIWRSLSGQVASAMKNPTAIALSPDEKRLYVSCTAAGFVLFFDLETGKAGRAADAEGHRPGAPFGLAFDGEGNLYVSDEAGRKVLVYAADGKYLRTIGEGMFVRPAGIAFDRRRQLLYVVDGSNGGSPHHAVEVFAPDGRHLRTMGTRGSNPGEFNFPTFVTVAADGRVLVADTLNFRIQIFDPEGTLLTTFGEVGEGSGQFGKLKGLAFDAFGILYAVDGQIGIVQMFSPGLRPLMAFGGIADLKEGMHNPIGIVIDSKNNIYVSDFGFNKVLQYKLINTTAADVAAADGAQQPGAAGPPPPKTEAAGAGATDKR